jgi:hypothetical protein
VTGDFNVYTNTEGAYLKFLESQGNNVGRCVDLLPAGVWHDGGSFAAIHTQSTCLSGCSFGEATGGHGRSLRLHAADAESHDRGRGSRAFPAR